jgi:hypothetical protein
MLIEPASNVSVPLTVVIRTRSNAPDKFGLRPPQNCVPVDGTILTEPEFTHVLLFCKHNIIFPFVSEPLAKFPVTSSPAVDVAEATELVTKDAEEEYPDVVIEPEPICISMLLLELVETPANITVIRFTQEGMLVKSILVPLVEATAVPLVNTPTPVGVPPKVGLVRVLFVRVCVAESTTILPVTFGTVSVLVAFWV